MCRKQPIPTNLDQVFGENYLAQDIYIYCLLRARNDENPYEKEYAGALHTLQRWQWVFGDDELAKRFRCDRKTIRKTLEKLQNVYNKMDIKRTTKGTVYSVVWYDEVVNMDNKMDNKGTTKGQQRDNSMDTNKNDKNDKSEKEWKDNIIDGCIVWWNKQEELPKCRWITKDIKKEFEKILWDYTKEEISHWFWMYLKDIRSRTEDMPHYSHRRSFYEFIKRSNWLRTFINK